MSVTIFHNPRCSKSRQTLQLLEENGVHPRVVEYLNTPPDAKTLQGILKKLKMKPRELLRKNETLYRELNLDDPALSDAALIEAMVQHPILIERPIVIHNRQAAIGRPPDAVLEIL